MNYRFAPALKGERRMSVFVIILILISIIYFQKLYFVFNVRFLFSLLGWGILKKLRSVVFYFCFFLDGFYCFNIYAI